MVKLNPLHFFPPFFLSLPPSSKKWCRSSCWHKLLKTAAYASNEMLMYSDNKMTLQLSLNVLHHTITVLAKWKRKSACASVSLKHGASSSGSSPGLSRCPNISAGSGRATPFRLWCRSVKEEQEERWKHAQGESNNKKPARKEMKWGGGGFNKEGARNC